MKKSILTLTASILILGTSSLYLIGCSQNKNESTHENMMEESSESKVYACPMHPEIVGKEGDKCSKCGMALKESESSSNSDHEDHKH
ncbi:MAG: heavy metal-binding domain-containing protein [Reichenbachiella sp.]|uniref:heavy metal-binding domain-containing protein n=1 Tax=Reichenbachiella sp. TaxID=2184521 RepID=UPI003298D3AE